MLCGTHTNTDHFQFSAYLLLGLTVVINQWKVLFPWCWKFEKWYHTEQHYLKLTFISLITNYIINKHFFVFSCPEHLVRLDKTRQKKQDKYICNSYTVHISYIYMGGNLLTVQSLILMSYFLFSYTVHISYFM